MENQEKINTITINGTEYIRKSSITEEIVNFIGEETVASRMIGKNVIVRSRNEGINAGTVVIADESGVELKNCRRIWYHKPADKSVCWYEGVAKTGLSKDSKVSCTVNTKTIVEDYSMTVCSDEAFSSIMEIKPHVQN